MANSALVAISVGTVVAVIGLMMIRSHRRTWDLQKNDVKLADQDRVYLHKRYRRRMQTSATMVLLGLLLAAGEVIPWPPIPWPITIYWGSVLLLALWVIVQALGDILSTGAHAKVSLSQVREKQRELERQLEEYKSRRSNGRHSDD